MQLKTRETLRAGLRELGLVEGDTVWVHSSFKSLGSVEGGAGTVVAAFEDIVGPRGLIAMPSFNLVSWEDRTKTWDVGATRSTAGWITEFFRKMPGTHRSDHYSHSVAARGEQAEQLVTFFGRDSAHGGTAGAGDTPSARTRRCGGFTKGKPR